VTTAVARKSEQLRGESARLLQEARDIKDRADNEGRSLTGEERQTIDRKLDASREKLDEAKLEERMAGIGADVAPEERGSRLPEVIHEDEEATPEEREAVTRAGTQEYRDAFLRYCRGGDEGITMEDRRQLSEVRALTEGVDADGGYLAPPQLLAGVQRELEDIEQIAPRANTLNTNARAIQIVKGVDGITFQWVAELQQKPEDQPSLGRDQIVAHTAAVIIRVSDELLEDTSFGLEAYLSREAAAAKAEGEEIAFAAGTGAGQPFGILTRLNGEAGTPNRYTTADIGALGGDDFVRALYALKVRYRRRASWLLGTQAILAARLLKDGNNNYIWAPGLQVGQPDAILGKPVIESEADPLDNAVAAGNDVGVVGDLRRYTILRRLNLQVKRLEELYAETDEVGFRFRFRTGGDVQNTAAFRSIRVRAT